MKHNHYTRKENAEFGFRMPNLPKLPDRLTRPVGNVYNTAMTGLNILGTGQIVYSMIPQKQTPETMVTSTQQATTYPGKDGEESRTKVKSKTRVARKNGNAYDVNYSEQEYLRPDSTDGYRSR